MIAWYQTVFEADVVYQNPTLAFSHTTMNIPFAFANLDVFRPAVDGGGGRGEIV